MTEAIAAKQKELAELIKAENGTTEDGREFKVFQIACPVHPEFDVVMTPEFRKELLDMVELAIFTKFADTIPIKRTCNQ
jgi:hypothetical protein